MHDILAPSSGNARRANVLVCPHETAGMLDVTTLLSAARTQYDNYGAGMVPGQG